MARKEKVRLNLEVSLAIRDRLELLREQSEAESMTEVIRRALAIYEHLLAHSAQGGTILLRTHDKGPEKQLLLV